MKNKIKVGSLFLSMEIGTSGGAGKVHATLGKIIDPKSFETIYIQLEDNEPRYDHQGSIINLKENFLVGFGIKKILSLFRLAYRIKRVCHDNSIDIIIGQGDFFFMVTGLSKLIGNKSHCIGLVHTTLRIWPWRIQKILVWFLQHNDTIVCISENEKKYLSLQGDITKNLFLIHNSVDVATLQKEIEKPITKKDIGIFSSGVFTYLAIGRFSYQKNFKLLIDAFQIAYHHNHNIQLVILGDGDEYEDLLEYIRQLGISNIHLIGKRSNPMSYMKYADCFVMSSRFEGYPMVMLEACIGGLPIVSLDIPTGPAEIIYNNEGGLLLPYNGNHQKDAQTLASGLLEIQTKDLKKISQRNKEFVNQYDNSLIGQERNNLFQSIIGSQVS